jgi:hypothetical protein
LSSPIVIIIFLVATQGKGSIDDNCSATVLSCAENGQSLPPFGKRTKEKAVPDSESASFDVYFEPSSHVALYEGQGVVRSLPVLVRRSNSGSTEMVGDFFVLVDGRYYAAASLTGFVRFEGEARSRPRLKPLPSTTGRVTKIEMGLTVSERLSAAQEMWKKQREEKENCQCR